MLSKRAQQNEALAGPKVLKIRISGCSAVSSVLEYCIHQYINTYENYTSLNARQILEVLYNNELKQQ